ncbi:MAG: HAMP domain-containing protein, partial [Gallionella sp.]
MKNLIQLSMVLAVALLVMLSGSSADTEVFSVSYYVLLGLTGLLALSLMGLIGYQLWRLRNKLKRKVFGARLTLRLVTFFTLIGVLPGILIYAVSVQFLDKSIESWFDVRVEKALEGGLNLGRSGLDNSLNELAKKAKFTALLLAEKQPGQYQQALDQLVGEQVAQEVAMVTKKGDVIAFSSGNKERLSDLPDGDLLRLTLDTGEYAVIDTLSNQRLALRALVAVNFNAPSKGQYVLQFIQPVPKQIVEDAETVQAVYRDYQELTFSRLGLKRLYAITLTLSLLVVMLTAVSAAFFLSERLGSSLETLAEGTRAVAQGDFTGQYPIRSSDELGALTGLFNQMIRQLSDAKTASESQQRQVVRAKGYLESVLTHLSSGVLGLDDQLQLRSVNTSAVQILGAPLHEMRRTSLAQIAEKYTLLNSFCRTINEAIVEIPNGDWQRQIERVSKNGNQILLIRGTRLPTISGAGFVVVFDDIS